MIMLRFLIFFVVSFNMSLVWALSHSNLYQEKKYAKMITPHLNVGVVQQLTADKIQFLGLYTEAHRSKPLAGVILLHDIEGHPDWPDVISPLRTELPNYGWSTLAIQLPIKTSAPLRDYAQLIDESTSRIKAAFTFLKEQKIKKIALIGYGMGAIMGLNYLNDAEVQYLKKLAEVVPPVDDKKTSNPNTNKNQFGSSGAGKNEPVKPKIPPFPIITFVAISMDVYLTPEKLNITHLLKNIQTPILDLYGSQDKQSVLDHISTKKSAAQKAEKGYFRQVMIIDADQSYFSLQETLVKRVRSWLYKHSNFRTDLD